jgi:ribosomal-protein-alanine N-acetyltransferase
MAASAPVLERMIDDDVPAVLAIERASPEGSGWDEEQLRGELTRGWAHLWVLRAPHGEGNKVAAFLATWLVQDELHVLNVATDPAHRRRGHARALMRHGIAFGVEHGVRMVLLEVRRSNAAAIALYRQLGFTAMAVRTRYYSNDEDAVEMVLRLDPSTGAVLPGRDEVRV